MRMTRRSTTRWRLDLIFSLLLMALGALALRLGLVAKQVSKALLGRRWLDGTTERNRGKAHRNYGHHIHRDAVAKRYSTKPAAHGGSPVWS